MMSSACTIKATTRKGKRRGRSRSLRRFVRNPLSLTGLILITVLSIVAVFAPLLAPQDPAAQHLSDKRATPFGKYILGADQYGRDILSRLIYGARVSMLISVSSVFLALVGGLVVGTVCGYFGGYLDAILMRFMDLLLSFPYLLLAIALASALGTGIFNTSLAISIWAWPTFARIVRATVMGIKEQEYITAAKALGAPTYRIILFHIIPNSISPVIVYATLFMANAIMMEAALSFLGLGIRPPTASWGEMISSGRRFLMVAPHVSTIPGLAITLAVLGFNLLGDGLRDALDPTMKVQ